MVGDPNCIDCRLDYSGVCHRAEHYAFHPEPEFRDVSREEWEAAKPEDRFVSPVKSRGGYSGWRIIFRGSQARD